MTDDTLFGSQPPRWRDKNGGGGRSPDADSCGSTSAFPQRPPAPRKGRGAVSNMQGRYELQLLECYDDGWQVDDGLPQDADKLHTEIRLEQAKSIITRNASPDIPFNISINPYRGCEHGCIYCFARPTHSYLGLSPGLDFESRITAKSNAASLLRQELAQASYVPEPIALGVNTDAYQPCERQLKLTRELLEVCYECEQPIGLITKSSLIERDRDLLAPMAAKQQAIATVTLTTLDPDIARTLEPRATAPSRRLRTIRTLTEAGIPVGVNVAPVIPFITDAELENIVKAAAEAGAVSASYIILRLPWEVSPLFQQWLEAHFPARAQRVMNRIRDMHGGQDYQSQFGTRMRGEGLWAELIQQRFRKVVRSSGITARSAGFSRLDASHFRRPVSVPAKRRGEHGAGALQTDLFN